MYCVFNSGHLVLIIAKSSYAENSLLSEVPYKNCDTGKSNLNWHCISQGIISIPLLQPPSNMPKLQVAHTAVYFFLFVKKKNKEIHYSEYLVNNLLYSLHRQPAGEAILFAFCKAAVLQITFVHSQKLDLTVLSYSYEITSYITVICSYILLLQVLSRVLAGPQTHIPSPLPWSNNSFFNTFSAVALSSSLQVLVVEKINDGKKNNLICVSEQHCNNINIEAVSATALFLFTSEDAIN